MAIIVTTVASVSCKLLAVKSFFSRIVYGLTGLMWGAYWLLAVVMSVVAVIGAKKERNKTCFALPFKIYDVEEGKVVHSEVVDTNGSGHGALAGVLMH